VLFRSDPFPYLDGFDGGLLTDFLLFFSFLVLH
jgi:hypothetical protein